MKINDLTTLFATVTPLTPSVADVVRGIADYYAGLHRVLVPPPGCVVAKPNAGRDTVTPILCASDPTEGDEGLASLSQRSNRTYFGPGGEDQLLAVVGDRSVALMDQIIPRRLQ